ncbi:MAG: hypothetical protein AB7P14_12605 [Blastocatellales bacterium]
MKTLKQMIVILLCLALCAPLVMAQPELDKQQEAQATKQTSQDVQIIIQHEQVRFTARKEIVEMQLQVFDQWGRLVFDSGPAGCDGTPYTPPDHNLVSYSFGACRNEFTPGQINKVWQVLNTASNRKNLIDGYKFFVDPAASSSNTKCTSTAPCKTVDKAIQVARDGAIIHLKPGVHRTSSGGGNKRVTLQR